MRTAVRSHSTVLAVLAALAAAVWLTPEALASEGGAGHYLPGALATIADLPPTDPGFVLGGMYLYYGADAGSGRGLPLGGQVTANLDIESHAWLAGGFYTFEREVVGARFSVGALLPFIWIEGEARVTLPGPTTVRRKDSQTGFGDLALLPVMLAWEVDDWQLNGTLTVTAPTGEYERGSLANPGLNYWTFDPAVGVSYNNDDIGFNAALFTGFSLNTRNPKTNYHSGATFHLDGSIQQLLPLGPGFAGAGAEVFWLEQIEGDSGSGASFGSFKGRTAGVGPVITYILPFGEGNLVSEVRWLPELDVKRRVEGDYVWVKVLYQF